MGHDLDAMLGAIREDTSVVYVCNPNNPTGTVVSGDLIEGFVEAVPDSVLVVIDEAYHDFVTDPTYRSAVPLAVGRPNVVVLRTFSKIYGLAAHRIGYVLGQSPTLTNLQRTQAPFTVSTVAQAAAMASLGQPDELEKRRAANAASRHQMLGALAERGLLHTTSETNFVYFMLEGKGRSIGDEFLERGVIVRPMSRGWIRVTLGNPEENRRFVAVLDQILGTRDLS
jgi:histidinol-phosphate aminotransferase